VTINIFFENIFLSVVKDQLSKSMKTRMRNTEKKLEKSKWDKTGDRTRNLYKGRDREDVGTNQRSIPGRSL